MENNFAGDGCHDFPFWLIGLGFSIISFFFIFCVPEVILKVSSSGYLNLFQMFFKGHLTVSEYRLRVLLLFQCEGC